MTPGVMMTVDGPPGQSLIPGEGAPGEAGGGIVLVHSASLTLTCSFIPAAQCPGTLQMK